MCDICKLIHINYDKFSKIFIENDGSAPYYIEDPFDEAYDTRGGWTHQNSIKFVRKKWQDSDVERYWKNISVLLKAEIIVKKGLRKRYLDSICTTLEQNFCVKVLDQSIKFYQKEMGNLSEEKEGLEISIVNQRSRDTFDNVDVEFIDVLGHFYSAPLNFNFNIYKIS